jgi:hypothetical protein
LQKSLRQSRFLQSCHFDFDLLLTFFASAREHLHAASIVVRRALSNRCVNTSLSETLFF